HNLTPVQSRRSSDLAADGPMFVTQDGTGTATANGSLRYVAVNTTSGHGTDLVEVSRKGGSVGPALRLSGAWGLPYTSAGAEGLSDRKRTRLRCSHQI